MRKLGLVLVAGGLVLYASETHAITSGAATILILILLGVGIGFGRLMAIAGALVLLALALGRRA